MSLFNFGIVDTLSSGPGQPPYTLELADGSYCFLVAGQWYLQERGQRPRRMAYRMPGQEG